MVFMKKSRNLVSANNDIGRESASLTDRRTPPQPATPAYKSASTLMCVTTLRASAEST
jgi:hypothetical protein